MTLPAARTIPNLKMQLDGFIADYLRGVTDQWLLPAPAANPAILEMFRDRDASPVRAGVEWCGEFAGKYLTSAVQILRITADPALKASLRQFVRRLISFQDTDGYLGPWTRACRLTNKDHTGTGNWDTWSHYHIMMGLTLWHEVTRDADALTAATKIADALCRKYLGNKKPRLVDTPYTEMNLAPAHVLPILHRKTRDERYLKLARQFVDEFAAKNRKGPLAGDYLNLALAGIEYHKTPKPRWESLHPVMALAELYWATGDPKFRDAYAQIWWSNLRFDRHNNGGYSSGEQAKGDPYDFGGIETCCTIAWMATTVEMLKLTADSVAADELELSTLNSVVGMHSVTGRWCTYNTPMNGVKRTFLDACNWHARPGGGELSCCTVNSPRGFGYLSDWACMRDRHGLILNYYGPSTFSPKLKPGIAVTLTQQTNYPVDPHIKIRVAPTKPAEFTLKLRIPHWSKRTSLKVNGKTIPKIASGQYAHITRRWRRGDTIDLKLDFALHFWTGEKDCKGFTSVYRGPILLAYDHRYNLEHATPGKPVNFYDYLEERRESPKWNATDCLLNVPALSAKNLKLTPAKWTEWMPPVLLVKCKAANGKTVHLCDFGSAGETGTPFLSWLPVKHLPPVPDFSPATPLGTNRCTA